MAPPPQPATATAAAGCWRWEKVRTYVQNCVCVCVCMFCMSACCCVRVFACVWAHRDYILCYSTYVGTCTRPAVRCFRARAFKGLARPKIF